MTMFGNGGITPVMNVDGNRDGNGWGGDGWWVLVILFAMFGGWGGNGFGWGGNGGSQAALTRGDLCMDMNFSDLENAVRGISADLNGGFRTIDNAICNLGYNNAQLANGIQMQIGSEFRGLDNAICTLGFNNQAGFNALSTQLAQCCCEQKSEAAQTRFAMQQGFCDLGNQLSNATRDIIDNQNAQYMRSLENENQTLRLAASQTAQNEYLVDKLRPCPIPSYQTCNPWATNGTSYNGCNGFGGCACAA